MASRTSIHPSAMSRQRPSRMKLVKVWCSKGDSSLAGVDRPISASDIGSRSRPPATFWKSKSRCCTFSEPIPTRFPIFGSASAKCFSIAARFNGAIAPTRSGWFRFPHRRRFGISLDRKRDDYSAADIFRKAWEPHTSLPGFGSEAWAWTDDEKGVLIAKYNLEEIEFSLFEGEYLVPRKDKDHPVNPVASHVPVPVNHVARFGGNRTLPGRSGGWTSPGRPCRSTVWHHPHVRLQRRVGSRIRHLPGASSIPGAHDPKGLRSAPALERAL